MHIHQPISVAARCAAILLSASPPPYTGPGTPLNDATFQADRQVLCAPLDGLETSTLKTLRHALWEGKTKVGSTQLYSVNTSPKDVALKAGTDCLDFGEFRHEC